MRFCVTISQMSRSFWKVAQVGQPSLSSSPFLDSGIIMTENYKKSRVYFIKMHKKEQPDKSVRKVSNQTALFLMKNNKSIIPYIQNGVKG